MKIEKDEPKEYFERNIPLLTLIFLSGIGMDWLAVHLLIQVNPWGTLIAIPGLVLTLQGLWLLVNPFAIVYEDRFEVKHSFFYNKQFYFLDTKDAKINSNLNLVYNDGEMEAIPMFGIRASHKSLFHQKLLEKINFSIKNRDF